MRTVIVYLASAVAEEVSAFLSGRYIRQIAAEEFWVDQLDAALYIRLYSWDAVKAELGEDLQRSIVARFMTNPPVCLVVDISGRTPGETELLGFLECVLDHFPGVATDDYSDHLWTLEEIRTGKLSEGHPFFDYNGW